MHAVRPNIARRIVPIMAAVIVAIGFIAAGTFSANAAPPTPTTNPPLHQPTPITAAGFGHDGSCDPAATQDLFHFVLPGGTATFTAFSATFLVPGVGNVTYTLGTSANVQLVQSGKGINVLVPAGSTLLSASATSSTPVPFFNLSHTCVGGGGPSPSPSPSPSGYPRA